MYWIYDVRNSGRKAHDNFKARAKAKIFYDVRNLSIATEFLALGRDVPTDAIGIWCPVFKSFKAAADKQGDHNIPVELGEDNLCALLGNEPFDEPFYTMSNLIISRAPPTARHLQAALFDTEIAINFAGSYKWDAK